MHEYLENENNQVWLDSKIVMYQIASFIVIYGVHLTFCKWFLSLLVFVAFSFLTTWSLEVIVCGILGFLLAVVVRIRFSEHKHKWWRKQVINNEEYAIHLILIPFILAYYITSHVPQTSYPIGIILAFLLWSLLWLISYTIDFYDNGELYYYTWLVPPLTAFVFGFFFYKTLWISVLISVGISLILMVMPFETPKNLNKYL
jgi:hypothetical protein